MKTAVIIKGNPKLIDKNKKAEEFYIELKKFLEKLGYEVSFDPGEPYTQPKEADLWVGHSRGSDRLRFAGTNTIVIGIGVPESTNENTFPIVNHPNDLLAKKKYSDGKIISEEADVSDDEHYVLSDVMKSKIEDIIKGATSR